MVKFFRVTPPSVHGMVVKLEERGLITREPGVPRLGPGRDPGRRGPRPGGGPGAAVVTCIGGGAG